MASDLPLLTPLTYSLSATPRVPNSCLPIVHYKDILPSPTASSVASAIEPNNWLRGGRWRADYKPHFHAVAHECCAVISGAAVFSLGRAEGDEREGGDERGERETVGIEVVVERGDVFVLPAGVSHCVLKDLGDFEYVGFYPPNPRRAMAGLEAFDMHMCDASPEETAKLKEVAAATSIPDRDPLYGIGGPLPRLWREADAAARLKGES